MQTDGRESQFYQFCADIFKDNSLATLLDDQQSQWEKQDFDPM